MYLLAELKEQGEIKNKNRSEIASVVRYNLTDFDQENILYEFF